LQCNNATDELSIIYFSFVDFCVLIFLPSSTDIVRFCCLVYHTSDRFSVEVVGKCPYCCERVFIAIVCQETSGLCSRQIHNELPIVSILQCSLAAPGSPDNSYPMVVSFFFIFVAAEADHRRLLNPRRIYQKVPTNTI